MFGEPIKRALALGAEDGSPGSLWLDMFLPVTYREVADDGVRKELANLQHGFDPPSREVLGLRPDDYEQGGQDAYDRWSELHGSVKVDGRTMKSALRKLFGSPEYQRLEVYGTGFEDSPRVKQVRAVIGRYRRAAWEQVLEEYPDLARDLHARQREQRTLRAGGVVESIREIDPFRIQ